MNEQYIKDTLKQICQRQEIENPTEVSEIWSGDLGTVYLDQDDHQAFKEALDELLNVQEIAEQFERKELNRYLQHIITKVKHDLHTGNLEDDAVEERLEQEVNELTTYLYFDQNRTRQWYFLVPIENLELHLSGLQIGPVGFKTFNRHDLHWWMEVASRLVEENTDLSAQAKHSIHESDREQIEPDLSGYEEKTCAYITIEERNVTRASEKAILKVKQALNTLYLFWTRHDEFMQCHFGIKGDIQQHKHESTGLIIGHTSTDEEELHFLPHSKGYLAPFFVNQERLDSMRSFGLETVNSLLSEDSPSHVGSRLMTAIWWFAQAAAIHVPEVEDDKVPQGTAPKLNSRRKVYSLEFYHTADRFVKLITALEALLVRNAERDDKKGVICARGSQLMTDDARERSEISHELSGFYDKRSEIVHSGATAVSKIHTFKLLLYTQLIMVNFVNTVDLNATRTEDDLFRFFENGEGVNGR